MKKICALMVIGLFLGIAPNVFAQADVGTKICRDVQLLAQATAGEEEDWRNHGGRVSAASDVVKPLKKSGVITPECASCIMHQFARKIAIDDQELCGPDRICGDGELDPSEECDDGNNVDGDGCDANCVVEFCGDGILQPDLGEECDDGNNDPGDGCNEFCEIEEIAVGACCPDVPGVLPLECTEVSESDCLTQFNGQYQGDSTECAQVDCGPPPDLGACCLPTGDCFEGPLDLCLSQGGDPNPGTTCAQVGCGPT
jgi:cysteine-rich repeat protein